MRGITFLFACVGVVACTVGPDFHRPPPPRVGRYTAQDVTRTISADGIVQVMRPGAQLAATWWQLFRSAPLDALVRTALVHNASLDAARASLRRSEYSLRAGYGVFYPQIDANVGAMRQRFSPARFGAAAPTNVFNLYTLSGVIGYTLDVFGGQRRSVEALRAQVDVQCYSLAAARLTVTGNVVNTAIARAAYADEIRATEELAASQWRQVEIARAQERAGTTTHASVTALETQAATTEATLPPLRQQLAAASALLASLVGTTPGQWQPPAIPLADFTLPRDVPVSVPSLLVRQRPDILIAEATLHVSSANVGVATAALFPSFRLDSTFGQESPDLASLLTPGRFVWSIAGTALAPIFRGGTLTNQRRAAVEAYRESLATYHQTVLDAFRVVATSLEALVHDAQLVDARARALAAATETRHLILANYEAGLVNYLDVLSAEAQYQQARLGHIDAQAIRLQDTVTLFIALGGGWWGAADLACAGGERHATKRTRAR